MIALKDDAFVLEFHCVWDDPSHQTSHALERRWSQQYFGAGGSLQQADLNEGASQREFPYAEIFRWISQSIKK